MKILPSYRYGIPAVALLFIFWAKFGNAATTPVPDFAFERNALTSGSAFDALVTAPIEIPGAHPVMTTFGPPPEPGTLLYRADHVTITDVQLTRNQLIVHFQGEWKGDAVYTNNFKPTPQKGIFIEASPHVPAQAVHLERLVRAAHALIHKRVTILVYEGAYEGTCTRDGVTYAGADAVKIRKSWF
jgi:hypothetical protein